MRRSTTSDCVVTCAGIDYHKKFSVVTLGDQHGRALVTQRLPNDPHAIRAFFADYPKIACAIESCRGYEWLVDLLKEIGMVVHVANAHEVKLIAHSRCKTDKIDSRILMELLAIGFLPTCYQPTPQERQLRERLRWRCQLVRNATRLKLRIHALVDKENLGASVGKRLTGRRNSDALKGVRLSAPGRQELLDDHLRLLQTFEQAVKREDAWVKLVAQADPRAKLLTTIPGIGEFSALLILAELGDVNRFKRSAQVINFAGLTPSLYQSSDTKRSGRLTKHGSSALRWILVQDGWMAIRSSPVLRLHFASVRGRCGFHAAIISVARKLLAIAFRVLKDNKPFDETLVGPRSA